jgi:DNA-binding response OmpR family regulator
VPDRPVVVVTDEARLGAEISDGMPAGFSMHLAEDARAASRLMVSVTPAVVVVDIRTGSAGGVGLARDMSQEARLARVPILMLLERPQDEWLAKTAGARATRTRPVSAEVIARDIRELASS